MPKENQMYREKSSVTSVRCIKVFQAYQMVSSESKSIAVQQVSQSPEVIKSYQIYIKCIKVCHVY